MFVAALLALEYTISGTTLSARVAQTFRIIIIIGQSHHQQFIYVYVVLRPTSFVSDCTSQPANRNIRYDIYEWGFSSYEY